MLEDKSQLSRLSGYGSECRRGLKNPSSSLIGPGRTASTEHNEEQKETATSPEL